MIHGLLREHPLRNHCDAIFVSSGKDYFDRLVEMIQASEKYIHIQTYIFDEDETGKIIIHELIRAAKRGVIIMIVVDAYASNQLSENTIHTFRSSGIYFKQFSPLTLSRFKIGRRLHHKIILVDGEEALVGGINIANKYRGDKKHRAWLDFAVMLRGAVVRDIEQICEKQWKRKLVLQSGIHQYKNGNNPYKGEMPVRVLQNDWLRRRIEISHLYKELIRHAEHEIVLVVSYFLPSASIRRLLKMARNRGVKVRLILGEFSDVMLFKPASMYLYHWMLHNDMEIFEWKPSVQHGKLAMVDGKFVTIGSYNINALSDYGSLELNVLIEDRKFAGKINEVIFKIIDKDCKKITTQSFNKSNRWYLNMYRWACYQLIRLLLRLLFFVMQQRSVRY